MYCCCCLRVLQKVGAGINMVFVLPLFISLAYLVSTASRTTSSTVSGGYSYNNKLTCSCDADTGGTVESDFVELHCTEHYCIVV
jgi:hypothetical protein